MPNYCRFALLVAAISCAFHSTRVFLQLPKVSCLETLNLMHWGPQGWHISHQIANPPLSPRMKHIHSWKMPVHRNLIDPFIKKMLLVAYSCFHMFCCTSCWFYLIDPIATSQTIKQALQSLLHHSITWQSWLTHLLLFVTFQLANSEATLAARRPSPSSATKQYKGEYHCKHANHHSTDTSQAQYLHPH